MTDPILLVDGSSYLYRAFHALPALTTSSGQPTGAVRGVVSMLRKLQKDYPDGQLVVVFDAKGKTFRDELFDQYKAHRPPMPDDLRAQITPLHDIIRAMGLPLLIVDGVEADDVIGTLAVDIAKTSRSVIISTGDKDMAQLVNEHVTLVNTMTDMRLDEVGVEDKFGLPPRLIIDFLALMGDKVDNIPGVPGVGEKTALALLQNLGAMQTIYDNLDKVKDIDVRGAKSLGDKLAKNREQAFLSYRLATIKTDVALGLSEQDLMSSPPDIASLTQFYTQLEFKSWLDELAVMSRKSEQSLSFEASNSNDEPVEYDTILDQDAFDHWLEKLQQAPLFAFDTETTSLNYMEAQVVGVSFAVEAGKAAYLPLAHDYLGAPKQLDRDRVLAQLTPLLESEAHKKVGQNLKYDASVLANHGITLRGIAFDTMLESYVLNATANRHDMDTLALAHLGRSTIHFEDVAGKGAKQLTFNHVALEEAAPYAAEDADITLRLHHAIWPKLHAEASLQHVFDAIELPLVKVLSRIERNGVLVDSSFLARQSASHGETMQQLVQEAFELAGEEFNLASTKQLGAILFDKQSLPVIKKTPKGASSTAEDVLQELALDYPLPKIILEYRTLAKLKSTYTDKLPQMVNPATGRVHTSYHQAVTATGRLSSSDPNLQNIPIRTEAGRQIRQAFIASPGYKLVAADYSQIELRIMAHLSGDEGLTHAFSEGLDVHKATAAEVFDSPLDRVSDEQRRSAKAINFGLIYGMSAFGLAKQLRINRKDAQRYIDTYFERYPGVARYMDDIRHNAREKGYVETLFGRRLYLPEINASNGMRRQAAERTAINAPMQGTAADIIKRAMIDVHHWLENDAVDAKMVMQVHDELVLEARQDQADSIANVLCQRMSAAAKLSVPLLVEAGVGDNWEQAH